MRLRIFLPDRILLDETALKVNAEGESGHFCLLPGHIDFTSLLVPGLLSFENEAGGEVFLAVDDGTLVKTGDEVRISARDAVIGEDLGFLEHTVEERFRARDEREKVERSAVSKIEANFVKRFLELKKVG